VFFFLFFIKLKSIFIFIAKIGKKRLKKAEGWLQSSKLCWQQCIVLFWRV